MYGPHRPYGYAYGGSGGAYKTVSLAENTIGVWDGVVPYVMPSPMATNVFSVQAYAVRILKDKMPAIVDAIDPGGSGDMYYFEDFWKVPGYLGANPPESLKRARIQRQTTITKIVMSDEARRMGLPVPMASSFHY